MNNEDFLAAAQLFVRENLNDHVVAVSARWDPATETCSMTYYFDQEPDESDKELCEIALTDLVANFPDIKNDVCKFEFVADLAQLPDEGDIVFSRS